MSISDPFAEPPSMLGPSWRPVDLTAALSGGSIDPAPEVLRRDDGRSLFYAGKVHSVSGESESLKSWLLLVATAQEINTEGRVLWLDFEDSAGSVAGRLLALGCRPDTIAEHFSYVRPSDPLPMDGSIHSDGLTSWPKLPTLVVVDGVTEAMSLHGLEPNSNSDVATFMNRLTKPLARGAMPGFPAPAVVLIDHLVKNREQRSRFAIGAQHKLAGLDGAAYLVDLIKPFGHGLHGIARIDVAKDRPGRVREHAVGNHIADLHMRSEPDGSVFAELRPPDTSSTAGGTFRPTVLMERVSQYLEASTEPRSLRDVQTGVQGKTDAKRLALSCLVDEGYVSRESNGTAHLHRSTRPYRQEAST